MKRILALLIAAYTANSSLADKPSKPNIIILLADDLGYADVGCQGSKEVISPNIDSIEVNGVRCTAGFVTAPQCCSAQSVLIYAWNEHSEGGFICPTMGEPPDYKPNTSLLDELGPAIREWQPKPSMQNGGEKGIEIDDVHVIAETAHP
jgi:hypothetical protein